jgi:hypothetical protein
MRIVPCGTIYSDKPNKYFSLAACEELHSAFEALPPKLSAAGA